MIEEEPQSFDRVLSSMCTEPHPAARAAAHRFLATNPGDPATYPGVASLEQQVVEKLGELVGLDSPAGYVASGGTEANIQAVRLARNDAEKTSPNMVIPANGHFSFWKASELLDIECRESSISSEYTADVEAMNELIDENTILVAAVAGSTEYGRVDPVTEIAEIATDHGIHCHVDAAWGGFILPFTSYQWNFADAAIDSMTIDPHKFGRAAIPAGGFLVRESAMLDRLRVQTPYLESQDQFALGGTRSGGGVASAAAALRAQWPDGYERQFDRCQANAEWLASAFDQHDLGPTDPWLPIVTANLSTDTFHRLRDRGWRIARTEAGELRIVCMPHVTRSILQSFMKDLQSVTKN